MYSIYAKDSSSGTEHFIYRRESHVFGCHIGFIPKLLRSQLDATTNQPLKWHVPVGKILSDDGESFVIDLKPNNPDKENSMSLFELCDVWGHSAYGWTPAMLRLRSICVDGEPVIADPHDFILPAAQIGEPIYSFLYFAGSVDAGELTGSWNAPRSSPTNSALLWPETLAYFFDMIRLATPELLNPNKQ